METNERQKREMTLVSSCNTADGAVDRYTIRQKCRECGLHQANCHYVVLQEGVVIETNGITHTSIPVRPLKQREVCVRVSDHWSDNDDP